MNNIILIGFMGCGKSSVGRRLSNWQKMEFLDTDQWIEEKTKKSISEIFEQYGEEYFRQLETDSLKELIANPKEVPTVISVGGGLPIREENQKLLKQIGHVVYLRASADVIYNRVKKDTKRPLLQVEDPQKRIKELLCAREQAYLNASTMIVDVNHKSFTEVITQIMKEIAERKS